MKYLRFGFSNLAPSSILASRSRRLSVPLAVTFNILPVRFRKSGSHAITTLKLTRARIRRSSLQLPEGWNSRKGGSILSRHRHAYPSRNVAHVMVVRSCRCHWKQPVVIFTFFELGRWEGNEKAVFPGSCLIKAVKGNVRPPVSFKRLGCIREDHIQKLCEALAKYLGKRRENLMQ